ncbi:MAG: glycosyltransferase family 4 protein [Bacteroidales bacterium]|nr:glycosyltransferase family 4 protein [Bacteroidales bacterium]
MKIVYIFKSMIQLAGMERILSGKMNWLAEHGYNVYFITYEQGNYPLSFNLNNDIKHIDLNVPLYKRYKYGFLKKNWILWKMKKDFSRKIKHTISSISPNIIICTNYEYLLLDEIQKAAKSISCSTILESHVARETELTATHIKYPILHALAKLYDKRKESTINKFNHVVALTNGDARNWNTKNIMVIPNMSIYSESIKHESSKRIISVGRLNYQKGYDMLVDAWKIVSEKHPDWCLDIYGDGDLRDELQNKINNQKLSNTIFLKHSTTHIFEEYQRHEFSVMSSRYEGFSLVLVESMMYGLPCVTFNCPHGPAEIITNGENGILVPPDNIEQLAKSINTLIENSLLRKEMGINARERSKEYDINPIMDKWVGLFNSISS